MSQRFRDAQTAQNGACNPRPIANALVDAIGECYVEGISPAEDAAVFLILHQLAHVLVGTTDLSDQCWWECAMDALEDKLKED